MERYIKREPYGIETKEAYTFFHILLTLGFAEPALVLLTLLPVL